MGWHLHMHKQNNVATKGKQFLYFWRKKSVPCGIILQVRAINCKQIGKLSVYKQEALSVKDSLSWGEISHCFHSLREVSNQLHSVMTFLLMSRKIF